MTNYNQYSDYNELDYETEESVSQYEYESGWLDFLHGICRPNLLNCITAYRVGFEDCARTIVARHGGEMSQK